MLQRKDLVFVILGKTGDAPESNTSLIRNGVGLPNRVMFRIVEYADEL